MAESELMLLPDGRILAHHLTPEIAAWLGEAAGALTDGPAPVTAQTPAPAEAEDTARPSPNPVHPPTPA